MDTATAIREIAARCQAPVIFNVSLAERGKLQRIDAVVRDTVGSGMSRTGDERA